MALRAILNALMKSTAKELTLIGAFTALLIGGQLALSAISGVEVVTVLLLSFSFYFGARRGVLSASAFSLLRCIIYGFVPSVVILYLIYFNLFALLFGLLGKVFKRVLTVKRFILIVLLACIMTISFSLLDDVITPLFFGYDLEAAYGYFLTSFTAMIPQTICTFVTTTLLLEPLLMIYRRLPID